jgi:hypothetical protein
MYLRISKSISLDTTRKIANLRRNPNVSLVFGWEMNRRFSSTESPTSRRARSSAD